MLKPKIVQLTRGTGYSPSRSREYSTGFLQNVSTLFQLSTTTIAAVKLGPTAAGRGRGISEGSSSEALDFRFWKLR
ncbi:hypothetical protein SDJN02_02759, partial [Cucurbita argyrosperma subsp. argyrosperma]